MRLRFLLACWLVRVQVNRLWISRLDILWRISRKRDAENLKREKEWKEEVTRKGANKDKRKRPDNLVIQEIDADMTSPAFVMRTAEAQGRFPLYFA